MEQKYPTTLPSIKAQLAGTFWLQMTAFIERLFSYLHRCLKSPSELKNALTSRGKWFDGFGFPPVIWKRIYIYLLQRLDYGIAETWIAESPANQPIDVAVWKKVAPDYDWPLISGVVDIAASAQLIRKKKKKISAFPPELSGSWMIRILKKLDSWSADLDKLITAKTVVPLLEDVDEWVRAKLPFNHAWKVPATWPKERVPEPSAE
jgi:hypothetical protein